jgi:hypothetical protein
VGVIYKDKNGYEHRRSGVIIATTVSRVIMLLLNDGEEDKEVIIPIKNIDRICKPWELKDLTSAE